MTTEHKDKVVEKDKTVGKKIEEASHKVIPVENAKIGKPTPAVEQIAAINKEEAVRVEEVLKDFPAGTPKGHAAREAIYGAVGKPRTEYEKALDSKYPTGVEPSNPLPAFPVLDPNKPTPFPNDKRGVAIPSNTGGVLPPSAEEQQKHAAEHPKETVVVERPRHASSVIVEQEKHPKKH